MDFHEIAEIIAPPRRQIRLRQAEVVEVGAGTADVMIAGSGVVVTGVRVCAHVTPVVGKSLWVLCDGVDLLGIGVT